MGVPVLVAATDEAEAVDLVHPGRLGEVVRRTAPAELHVGLEGGVDADERGGGCVSSARFMPATVTTTSPPRTPGMTLVAPPAPPTRPTLRVAPGDLDQLLPGEAAIFWIFWGD